MKKLFAMMMAMAMALSLAACGSAQPKTPASDASEPVDESIVTEEVVVDPEDASFEAVELTGADLLAGYTWKYDSYEAGIRVNANRTYAFCQADGSTDGTLYMWNKLENDPNSIVLYNEFGGEDSVLTYEGDYENYTVTDSSGDTLQRSEIIVDGTYRCYLGTYALDENQLMLSACMPLCVGNGYAELIEVGDVLNNSDYDFMGIEVESIEQKDENWFVINGTMNLKHDETANIWVLDEDMNQYEMIGTGEITADTAFTDTLDNGEHADLAACLEANEAVYADVVVKGGAIVSIDVVEAF